MMQYKIHTKEYYYKTTKRPISRGALVSGLPIQQKVKRVGPNMRLLWSIVMHLLSRTKDKKLIAFKFHEGQHCKEKNQVAHWKKRLTYYFPSRLPRSLHNFFWN